MPTSVSTKSKTVTYAIAAVGVVAAAAFAYLEIYRGGGYRPALVENNGRGTPGYLTPGYEKPAYIPRVEPKSVKLPPSPRPAPKPIPVKKPVSKTPVR